MATALNITVLKTRNGTTYADIAEDISVYQANNEEILSTESIEIENERHGFNPYRYKDAWNTIQQIDKLGEHPSLTDLLLLVYVRAFEAGIKFKEEQSPCVEPQQE